MAALWQHWRRVLASISKKRDKYQALVRRKGHRVLCKTFSTKKAAEAWARQTESEMDREVFRDYLEAQRTTLGEVLLTSLTSSQKTPVSNCSRSGEAYVIARSVT